MCKLVKIIFLFAVAIWLTEETASEGNLRMENEPEMAEASREIFTSDSKSGWLLLEYINTFTVKFTAKGTGGADEVRPKLKADNVVYILIRELIPTNDTTDQIISDIFCYWIGPETTPAQKKKNEEFLPGAKDILQPFNITVRASDINTFYDKNIIDAVLSGSDVV